DAEARGVGTCTIRSSAGEYRAVLTDTGVAIDQRVPYDEAPVLAIVVSGHDTATCTTVVPGYSPFDHLLAAIKAAGADPGREAWLCQIALTAPLEAKAPLTVTIRQRSQLFLYFEVVQDGQMIGSVCAKWRE